MHMFRRALATTVASLTFAAAGIAVAGSAAASPEDGQGCVGAQGVPAAYVCVISLSPEVLVPTTSTVPVQVPPICFVVGCTTGFTVDVPAQVQPGGGVVAVLWYQGQYYPIGFGIDTVTTLVSDTLTLAGSTIATVQQTVDEVVAGLPTAAEVVDLVLQEIDDLVNSPVVQNLLLIVQRTIDNLPTPDEVVDELREDIQGIVDELDPTIDTLRERILAVVTQLMSFHCERITCGFDQ